MNIKQAKSLHVPRQIEYTALVKTVRWAAAMLALWATASQAEAAKPKPPPTRTIAIVSTPPGADVYLGTKETPKLGVTPIKRAKVPMGPIELVFVLQGYREAKLAVEVDRKTREVTTTLSAIAKLDLRAATEETSGASVVIDGKAVGQVPVALEVEPGRHMVEVRKDGMKPFAQWLDMKGTETITLPVLLVKEAVLTGTIFVSSDVPGAKVVIDGQERGRVPLTLDVPPGPVLLEVHAENLSPFTKTVTVEPGGKVIVEAKMQPASSPKGTALVLSNVPKTEIWIDGVRTGTAPVSKTDLMVGTHTVEAKAEGYQSAQATLRINQGEQTVIKLDLIPIEAEYGRISVRSSIPGAKVFVDGGDRGPAPVELDQVPLGVHAITVRAEDHTEFTGECEVRKNQLCSLIAALTPLVKLSVKSPARDARLTLDGQEMGPLPFEGKVTAGDHVIAVEATGYVSKQETVHFQPGQPRDLTFELKGSGASPEEIAAQERAEREERKAETVGSSNWSGVPLAKGANLLEIDLGVPHIIGVYGTVGIAEKLAFSAGLRLLESDVKMQTVDLVLRAHAGMRFADALSLGAILEGSAGTDFSHQSSFGATLSLLGTLHFRDKATFTLLLAGDVFSDSVGDGVTDAQQTLGRLRFGGTLVVWVSPDFGLLFGLDYRIVGDERFLASKPLFGAIDKDPRLQGHAGIAIPF